MKLSIIVPVYNGEAFLRECLASVLASSLRDIEVVCVNDASTDSTAAILSEFAGRDSRVKIVTHDVNKGLFQARLTGMRAASGEWIGFVDADDLVSEDRFRQLVAIGEREAVDMVWGPFVFKYDNDCRTQDYVGPQFDRKMSRDEYLQNLLATCGRDFSWHLVWAKIYRRDLAQRVLSEFQGVSTRINMCEDVLYSIAFACQSESVFFAPSVEPYFYRRSDSNMTNAQLCSREKFSDVVQSLKSVYELASRFLSTCDSSGRLRSNLAEQISHYARMWHKECPAEYEDIKKNFESLFCPTQSMHESLCVPKYRAYHGEPLRAFKDRIADPSVEIVSFDVFDTLVVRPFWTPSDLFSLLWEDFQKTHKIDFDIDFKLLRMEAEAQARKNACNPEVTLDLIYETLAEVTGWEKSFVEDLKAEEIRHELKFCRARKTAFDLVGYARNLGKRVIAISDMYLPRSVIGQILRQAGFGFADEDIFVSSEYGQLKWNGRLFECVVKRLNVAHKTILHIGDNAASDVEMAQKCGLQSLHFPSPSAQLRTSLGADGRTLEKIFSRAMGCIDGFEARLFLGIRCRLAVAANFLYDNPFAHQARQGTFGGDIVVFGYLALGMHLLSVADWIDAEVRDLRLSGIHFLARDGFLPRLAYESVHGGSPAVPCDTWYLNRAFTTAFRLRSDSDFFNWLDYGNLNNSFDAIFVAFHVILGETSYAKVVEQLNGQFDTSKTIDECGRLKVAAFCRNEIYPRYKDEIESRQLEVIDYLKERLFGPNDATFDIGYSCRCESALARHGIRLTPLYMHLNGGVGLERSARYGLNVQSFYDYKQAVTGVVRELMFSSVEPKCERYGEVNGVFGPIFEKQTHCDYLGGQVIRTIQSAALAFVDDWVATFERDSPCLAVRRTDASLPYDYFLTFSTPQDHEFLSMFTFDDTQNGSSITPKEFWNQLVAIRVAESGVSDGSSDDVIGRMVTWPFRMMLGIRRCLRKSDREYMLWRMAIVCGSVSRRLKGVCASMKVKSPRRAIVFCACTWPVRMVCGGVACLNEHGLAYTRRRVLVHLVNVSKKLKHPFGSEF